MNQPIDSSAVWLENKLQGKVNRAGNEGRNGRGMVAIVMTGHRDLILKMTKLKISPQLPDSLQVIFRETFTRK